MIKPDPRHLPQRLRCAALLLYESLVHGESFEDFLARAPESKDDLEVWQVLDREFGGQSALFRSRYLQAGEARRCKQATLEEYFRVLELSSPFSRAELAAKAGVSEAQWMDWLLARDYVIPTPAQLGALVAGASLSKREAAHLRRLRELAVKETQPPKLPGLAEYLQREPGSLGPALGKVRARRGFCVHQVAKLAGVAGELWRRWESGQELPSVPTLDEVLKKLHWIWATDDALRGFKDEVPAPRDVKLWRAFLNDHEWEETDAQESWLLPENPPPEAVAAWREVQLARERERERRRAPEAGPTALEALAQERARAESTVGGFLRFRRETKLVTVEEMATRAGVDPSTWLDWESGERVPSLSELEAVAQRVFVTPWLRSRVLEIWRDTHGAGVSVSVTDGGLR